MTASPGFGARAFLHAQRCEGRYRSSRLQLTRTTVPLTKKNIFTLLGERRSQRSAVPRRK